MLLQNADAKGDDDKLENALHRLHISSSLMRRVTRHNNVGGLSEAKTLWPLDSLPPTSFLGGR